MGLAIACLQFDFTEVILCFVPVGMSGDEVSGDATGEHSRSMCSGVRMNAARGP
jgi:hypothetical protein